MNGFPTPDWHDAEGRVALHNRDAAELLRELPADSIEAVVTDPPAGISFMGKAWDHHKGGRDQWIAWLSGIMVECLRVLKPGGHAFVWSLPRTSHWTGTAIEDAGFEIRDCIHHLFGSGFPKSLDVSKAIDKAAGAEREDKFGGAFDRKCGPTGNKKCETCGKWLISGSPCQCPRPQDEPQTDAARQWSGWGTALKPAVETWWLARKPLSDSTVAANVMRWETGALNIDGCRIPGAKPDTTRGAGGANGRYAPIAAQGRIEDDGRGRWPANVTHDGSDEVVGMFPGESGGRDKRTGITPGKRPNGFVDVGSTGGSEIPCGPLYSDSGSAARFFYCAKASREDRDEGLDGFLESKVHGPSGDGRCWDIPGSKSTPRRNPHPTVKSTALMRYLCRLITPPGGIVLDPFAGSGSTGKAAILEGFRFIGIEREREYFDLAAARSEHALATVATRRAIPAQKELFA